jgi:hypothetical protein
MTPGREDLLIELGSGFQQTFTYLQADGTPVDLTNWDACMSVSKSVDSPLPIYQIDNETGITLDNAGHITIAIPADKTLEIPLDYPMVYGAFPGKGTSKVPPGAFSGRLANWDLKLFPHIGEPFVLLQGIVCFVHSPSSSTLAT